VTRLLQQNAEVCVKRNLRDVHILFLMNINGRFRATTQILLQLIACHGVLGRVLGDFEGAEVVLDFQLEGSAVGVCGVALPVIFGYSPRVQALPVSPELELARFGDFPGAVDNFELRLGYFYAVSGGTGDVPLAAPAFEVISWSGTGGRFGTMWFGRA